MAYTFRGFGGSFLGWGDDSVPPGQQVVLFPSDYEFRSKSDKMLYVLTILGREWAPRDHLGHRTASLDQTLASMANPRKRKRKTGFESLFA